jgi:hypothetical protein
MDTIFTLKDDEEHLEKINLDDLYEKKRLDDLRILSIFNKILNRIHTRIKTISRQDKDNHFCWFLTPEVILGCVQYDQAMCVTFLIDKLKENGFNVRYIHPNLLFISWQHWIPDYVRNEIKKNTGVAVDGYGKIVKKNEQYAKINIKNPANAQSNKFKSTKSYKPTNNTVYSKELLDRIKNSK